MDLHEKIKLFVIKNNIKLISKLEEKTFKYNDKLEFYCTYKKDDKCCKNKVNKQLKFLLSGVANTLCTTHTNFCNHDKEKNKCKLCHGKGLCCHSVQKTSCKICKGSRICDHDKQKSRCKICDGYELCKSEWCETLKNKKYNDYCLRCFINIFPGEIVCRNYKTKENEVAHIIKNTNELPECKWIADRIIEGGCSKRRPDLMADLLTHVVIVEVDENMHNSYNQECENKRIMEIFRDLGNRPVLFIRFNPDGYTKRDGSRVTSCWSTIKEGITIKRNKKEEWENRIKILISEVKKGMEVVPEREVTFINLFYDEE